MAAGTNKTGEPRLAPGELEREVRRHLAAFPQTDFTPHDLARKLNRSSGAVRGVLDRLEASGQAACTGRAPARYRHGGA